VERELVVLCGGALALSLTWWGCIGVTWGSRREKWASRRGCRQKGEKQTTGGRKHVVKIHDKMV
jgi:hypothetical protein